MAGELITLPLRLSIRAARATMSGGLQLTGRAVALVGDAVQVVLPGGTTPAPAPPPAAAPQRATPPPAPPRSRAPQRSSPAVSGEVPTGTRPTSPPAPLVEEPAHVSEQADLVAEFAEPGAEDGAGAEVRMDEPWDGYDQTPASELIVRLRDADSAELAAVKLYESAKRRRETVLTAVDREFRTKRGNAN